MRAVMPSAARPTATGGGLSAPVGGWNARDPVADMPPTDAIFLDNFFPRAGDVELRRGTRLFATLPADVQPTDPHDVRSLLSYNAPSGAKKLFAVADDGFYDISAGGTVASPVSAATNAAWESVNISTAGGSFLWCCNGVDQARIFDGTAWTNLHGTSTPALTGITSEDITNVSLFKSRLYLCKKDSLSFFYLPVNSIAGAASEFPLGALFRRGGYLVATGAWTLDGGNGPEDYFVAVSSEGEVIVYSGIDPSNAATWALKGVYYLGAPVSKRCLLKFNGDLVLMTVNGLFPLSSSLQLSATEKRVALSDKISKAWLDFVRDFGQNFGWSITLFQEAPFLLVNVPVVSLQADANVYSYQFVMNAQTKAWCRFTGMPSEVWGTHDGRLFYALHNEVFEAWTSAGDSTGHPVEGRIKTALFYPCGRGSLAHVTMVRPVITTTNGKVRLQIGLDSDYDEASLSASRISYANSIAIWDVSKWDEASWSGQETIAKWRSVFHRPGRGVSLRLRVLGKSINMTWNALDYLAQRGGLL